MKGLKIFELISGLILIAALVIVGTLFLTDHYLDPRAKADKAQVVNCTHFGTTHTVIVENNQANPKHTNGSLCDKLTIVNNDNTVRLMAFGEHEKHQAYDGVTEQELHKGQSLSVTLNQIGNFEFHDHIGDIVQGDFTVTK